MLLIRVITKQVVSTFRMPGTVLGAQGLSYVGQTDTKWINPQMCGKVRPSVKPDTLF